MNGTPASLVTLNTLANPDIKWETTTMLDVGVDVTLFSKLNITADWYRKNTDDILMKLDIPAGVGLNAPYQNAGKVRNTGWELSIGYNNRWRDFTFGVQANVSDVKNEIVDMRGKTATSGVLRNQEGYSIGSIYALESLGIIRTQEEADWVNANCPQFKEAVQIGDIRYADIDGSNTIDENDKTIVGSTIPPLHVQSQSRLRLEGASPEHAVPGRRQDGRLSEHLLRHAEQPGRYVPQGAHRLRLRRESRRRDAPV